MVSLILPSADTSMMNIFLKHVSHTFSKYFLVIQVDQAGWHSAKDLIIPENIRLIPQPAYSPELNPVEHIWEELREKAFSNRVFVSLDAVIDTLCDQLRQLEDNSKLLHSMTYFPILEWHLRVQVGITFPGAGVVGLHRDAAAAAEGLHQLVDRSGQSHHFLLHATEEDRTTFLSEDRNVFRSEESGELPRHTPNSRHWPWH